MAATVTIVEKEVAFLNRLQSFSIVNQGFTKLDEFFAAALDSFATRVSTIIDEQTIVVVGTCFVGEYAKSVFDENGQMLVEKQKLYTHTPPIVVDFETNIEEHFTESIVKVLNNKIEERELRGSGFKLLEIIEINIQVSSFAPLAGSSYIKLPKFLHNKKAIVNVKNNDQSCFRYAVLSALYSGGGNDHRPQKYDCYKDTLNFTGIEFPVRLCDIAKFEKQNSDISIHVYMFNESDKKVYPVRLSKETKRNHIHLLLLSEYNGETVDGDIIIKTHYCWIKNLSALLGKQISSNTRRKLFCDRCFNHFIAQQALDEHYVNCRKQNECMVEMPTADTNQIRFKKIQNQLTVPFIIYADIESLLKEPNKQFCNSDKTRAFQQHEAYSIGYYFKHFYDDTKSYYKSYRGVDCIDWFVSELRLIADEVYDILEQRKPMSNPPDEQQFNSEKRCHICGGEYTENDKPVQDHSHITGDYRGSAHYECNLQFQESRIVPVVFHNLSHYDAHFIVTKLAVNEAGPMTVLAHNDELYISFTKTFPQTSNNAKLKFNKFIKFRFIDSFRFMPSSLDSLASLVPSEKKKITHMELGKYSENQIKLLEKKGVFCYDYMDSWDKLNEGGLPSKELFYSKLTESHISEKDYEHACLVWDAFDIGSLGEYSDLYMQTDILLLADIFENFRETCHRIYGLDPAHYMTAPSLSFDAMLKYTKIEIELLTDIDMLLFIERGIRGGISQCTRRYAKANNKYQSNGFDPNAKPSYLIYLDANNLYGHSMSQYLPLKDFKWCEHNFTTDTILNIADDSDTGYIFEVDLEYSANLHDLHSDYPFCPEKRPVSKSSKQSKLLLTLNDKERYVVHYKMLKLILQQGLKLKKIHRVLQFEQRPWLKPYIDLNTELRMGATNDFDKNFFKLMVNAIFGKTMENVRGRSDIKLKTQWEGRYGARKLIVQPNYKRWTAFDTNFVAIHMSHTKILMCKPISIGMAVLDISKELMYNFFYNFLKPKYGENVELMYTDTDSFVLNVHTDCFYSDMLADIDEQYDTSDYAEDNPYGIPRKNKKKPGFFKDELNGQIMTEFVGLRSKMYAFKCDGSNNDVKKAKGVKKYVLKNNIQFSDYLNSILRKSVLVRAQNTFRSKRHCVYSIRQEKIALSPFDDKRFVLEDNITTLPWGHKNIPQLMTIETM